MRILAVETTGRCGSLALLEAQGTAPAVVGQVELPPGRRTAQSLAPATRDALTAAHWPAQSIGLVAVAAGPGSFTGLRIGVTAAKMFAYATAAQVLGINTLQILAAQVASAPAPLWCVLDAQREELFAAKFEHGDAGSWQSVVPTHIVAVDIWLKDLTNGDFVTGPVLSRLADRLPEGVRVTNKNCWHPQATTVGRVAWRDYQLGRRDDVWQLVPQYFRLSAAEEQRKAAEQRGVGSGE